MAVEHELRNIRDKRNAVIGGAGFLVATSSRRRGANPMAGREEARHLSRTSEFGSDFD